jgi:hypothetical protein
VAEWGRTTLELLIDELKRPVRIDESFDRRVMVRVRRLYAARRPRRGLRWIVSAANSVTHHPAWAAAVAAGVVAIVSLGVFRTRPQGGQIAAAHMEPVNFVYVSPTAKSVAVVGDFNNWGLGDSALVATNNQGVWSVTSRVPVGVHSYSFVVNGKFVADPTAPRSSGDDFGMPSSTLVVEDSTK